MEQHKYIIASDTRDILGTWTESNIIEVQSLPEPGNGARGIVVQGVGVKPRATKKGHSTVLTEHYNNIGQIVHTSSSIVTPLIVGNVITTTAGTAQVIVAQPQESDAIVTVDSDSERSSMINTLRPAKTKLGKARIRMKWTTEVNEYILRTYYTITNMETNCKHYRDTLHRLFNEEFPDVDVCAQRIADQRRAIVKNHLLPQERIDEIRNEVEQELQQQQQIQQVQVSHSGTQVITSGGTTTVPILVATPMMAMTKTVDPQAMTVWYGCVKGERLSDEGYSAAGPSGHKLRKLSHGEGSVTVTGHQQQQQHQPQHIQPQQIIIHTTGALSVGPHTITTTADTLRR